MNSSLSLTEQANYDRKLGIRDVGHQAGKRSRDVIDGLPRPRVPLAPPARLVVPQMYSPHIALSETYPLKPMIRPSSGHTSKNVDLAGPRRSSKSKSPTLAASENSDRVRGKDRGVEKERMRSSSSTRSADLGIEEDLVNMVEIFTLTICFSFGLGVVELLRNCNRCTISLIWFDYGKGVLQCSKHSINEYGGVCHGLVYFPSVRL